MNNEIKINPRPGVMFYFDNIMPLLENGISDQELGRITRATVYYAKDGIEPVLETDIEKISWSFTKPAIDKDENNYRKKQVRQIYGGYARGKENAIPFQEWLAVNGIDETGRIRTAGKQQPGAAGADSMSADPERGGGAAAGSRSRE